MLNFKMMINKMFVMFAIAFLATGLASVDVVAADLADSPSETSVEAKSQPVLASTLVESQQEYRLPPWEISAELGAMSSNESMYWTSVLLSRRLISEETNWMGDLIIGFAGREGKSYTMIWPSLRLVWRPENWATSVSTFTRVFAGPFHAYTSLVDRWELGGGVGFGCLLSLKKDIDIHVEVRGGYAGHPIAQLLLGVHLRWPPLFIADF